MIRRGFEPRTHSLEGCCSIQLSYRTIHDVFCNSGAKVVNLFDVCKSFSYLFFFHQVCDEVVKVFLQVLHEGCAKNCGVIVVNYINLCYVFPCVAFQYEIVWWQDAQLVVALLYDIFDDLVGLLVELFGLQRAVYPLIYNDSCYFLVVIVIGHDITCVLRHSEVYVGKYLRLVCRWKL